MAHHLPQTATMFDEASVLVILCLGTVVVLSSSMHHMKLTSHFTLNTFRYT